MYPVSHNETERRNQLDVLRDIWSTCQDAGQVAVISGPVGCGKTALLQAFVDAVVNDGAEVLSAFAAESERDLPLGVVGQLLDRPDLPSTATTRAAAVLDAAAPPWRTFVARPDDPAGAMLDDLCAAIVALAGSKPLVVAVDDAHLADNLSVRCLARLAQRLSEVPILVLLVETAPSPGYAEPWHADLPESVRVHHVPIEPLTLDGVADLLRRHEVEATVELSQAYHSATGGNLALLLALLADRRAVGAPPADVVVGNSFADAITTCLLRCDPITRRVAHAIAVLHEPVHVDAVGRHLDLDVTAVEQALRLLAGCGLLDGGRFRHPAIRSAVLAGMAPEERGELFQQVARLWRTATEPPPEIAEMLVKSGWLTDVWLPPALRRAAEQALAAGDLAKAQSYLRAAGTTRMDDRHQAELSATLAGLQWHTSPANVLLHLPELLSGVRSGQLTGRSAVAVVLYLLWHGRVDEAADILPLVCEGCVGDSAVLRLAQLVVSSLSFGYPGVVGRVRAELRPDLLPPQQSGIDAARTVLREAPLRVETVGLVFGALTVSAFAPGENGAWAEPPRPSIPESDLPVWRAFTLALQAELALRRGDLPAAAADAQQSLTDLGTDGWGAALGWPISILIYAASEAGDHAAAANHLAIPLPEGAFAGPFGLKYLLARGRYHLATGRVHAALNDFYACREAASRWELDLPELLPWRTELARAYQKLDRVRASAELVREQLNGLREDQHRLRGIALRILARTIEPGRRVTVLEEAVEHLRASGDRLETAHALTDLSVAWQHAGRVDLTRSTRHEAELLARECGTQIGPRRATANGPAAPAGAGPGGAAGPATLLSDAERLVAALAAKGYTNREVAHKLFLTVSTVEQHLTRVYRKLNVTKRRELPAWLRIGTFDDVAPGQIDDTGSS